MRDKGERERPRQSRWPPLRRPGDTTARQEAWRSNPSSDTSQSGNLGLVWSLVCHPSCRAAVRMRYERAGSRLSPQPPPPRSVLAAGSFLSLLSSPCRVQSSSHRRPFLPCSNHHEAPTQGHHSPIGRTRAAAHACGPPGVPVSCCTFTKAGDTSPGSLRGLLHGPAVSSLQTHHRSWAWGSSRLPGL